MNKDIKFRIWGNYQKPPRYMNPSEMPIFVHTWQDFLDYFNNPAWTFERFTGLKDQNGKEIYEGDICNIRKYQHLDKSRKWEVVEVLWGCEHGWIFRGYYNGKGNGDFFGVRFTEADEIEIVGNIFENPELLNNR